MRELSERMKHVSELVGNSTKIELTVLTAYYEADPIKQEAIDYIKRLGDIKFKMEPINQIESKITIEVDNDRDLLVCGECEYWTLKYGDPVCELTGEKIGNVKEHCDDFKQGLQWERLKRKDKNDNKEYETG